MKNHFLLQPFLFGSFPILSLFWHNAGETTSSDIVSPTVAVMGVTAILGLFFWILVRNGRKAALIVSVFWILFFSYGHAFDLIQKNREIPHETLFMVWGVVFVAVLIFVLLMRKSLDYATGIFNVIGASLVIMCLVGVIVFKIRAGMDQKSTGTRNVQETVGTIDLTNQAAFPDIYYIILDRYPDNCTLQEVFGFDNSDFTGYLESKGFYVAHQSKANYLKTAHSLASSLNMKYVNYLTERAGEKSRNWQLLFTMVADHEVWRVLKPRGYTFMHFGSSWGPTVINLRAEKNFNLENAFPEFTMTLFKTTILHPITLKFGVYSDAIDRRWAHRNRSLLMFDKLADMPDIEGPTFSFAHILLPHSPFVFDRNGKYLTLEEERARSREVNFTETVIYTNKKVMELIDGLLKGPGDPPIIVVQADEGPFPERYRRQHSTFNWKEATDAELREKMGILNAIFLPGAEKSIFYPSMTPVNTFLLIFNQTFGTDYELLPDKSYGFVDHAHLYSFFEITEKVNRECGPFEDSGLSQ